MKFACLVGLTAVAALVSIVPGAIAKPAKLKVVAKPAAVDPAILAQGERAFAQCKGCHTLAQGQPDGVGPNLFGFYGTRAGSHSATYKYSAAMKAYGVTWDDATLDTFLQGPTKAVPGTRMTYRGMTDPVSRSALIAYLRTHTTPAKP